MSYNDTSGQYGPASIQRPALPDINAETYPFDFVVELLDQAAFFNLYSKPEAGGSESTAAVRDSSNRITEFRISESLHRFGIYMETPNMEQGLRATNQVGGFAARFDSRWVLIPHDLDALPGSEPEPTAFDPTRSQRFAMLDGTCTFGDGRDGFRGFGTGLTFPFTQSGKAELVVGAVGTILDGFGRFQDHHGTYTYCGTLSEAGFRGNLLIRVMDPDATLRGDAEINAIESAADPEPDITYLLLRGQKRNKHQKSGYHFGPGGDVDGLIVSQQLRLFRIDFASHGGSLRSTQDVGMVIGKMSAEILFNILHPPEPGTDLAPIPFASTNQYTITDQDERTIGSFIANGGGEGRTFTATLEGAPGQQALRFGAFGPILSGTGKFAGMSGLMTDNSAVGIAPHALATTYVLRVYDPDRKYRAYGGGRA